MRNLQARIIAIALELVLTKKFQSIQSKLDLNTFDDENDVIDFEPLIEPICEKISE